MSSSLSNVRTALLESAQSEQLPSLPEEQSLGRSYTRSQTSLGHRPGASSNIPEQEIANDSVLKRKLRPKGHLRSVTFMDRFRTAAYAVSPTSTQADSHIVGPFGDSASLDDTTNSFKRFGSQHMGQQQQSVGREQGVMYANMLRNQNIERNKADSLSHTLRHARLIFEIFFTVACIIAAAAIRYYDSHTEHTFAKFWGVPLVSWVILAGLIFPTIRFAEWGVDLVVKLLELTATKAGLNNVHYVLIGLSGSLRLVSVALLIEGLILIIMRERKHDLSDKNLLFMRHLGLCFVIFALVELIKTFGCRLLSLRVNSESLFETLQIAIDKERMLSKIMLKNEAASQAQQPERVAQIAKLRDIPEWSVPHYLNDLYCLSLSADSQQMVSSFTDKITDLMDQFKDMKESLLDEHASHAAEFVWLTVRRDLTKGVLPKDDLKQYITDPEAADFTFSLFDLDGDGWVTEAEVHSRFQHMYRERRNLAQTLQDNDQVIRTLQSLVGAVMHVVALFLYMAIFGTDVGHLVISLSSMGLACAFVFGNSLRTMYESVIFLFVIRPYQVGDAIMYKDNLYWVKNFGLLSTQLIQWTGSRVWVPNQVLMLADLHNVTQSRPMQDRVHFDVDSANVTPAVVEDLGTRVAALIQEEFKGERVNRHLFNQDFIPFSYIQAVSDPLKYTVGLCYQLAFNGEKFTKVCEARTMINHVIGEWQRANDITHSTSVQPLYTYTGSS